MIAEGRLSTAFRVVEATLVFFDSCPDGYEVGDAQYQAASEKCI